MATRTETAFATVEEAIEDIRDGKFVVVVDAADRENEGDLTIAAQFATPEAINFMATHARGLICLCLTPERCDELGLRPMAENNEAPLQTAFTVSIEAREGVTTGISAADRSRTIQTAIDPNRGPGDLVQPGHVFPLKAKPGGVLERTGQTEAAVDLARLAGLNPAGVICEIMNDDGTMARVPDLVGYCERHGLKMITVADLIAYRRRHDKLVERVVATALPTDCGEQLESALAMIEREGQGVLLYLAQEGRGIGLLNKLRAYKLQEEGLDTVEANIELGMPADLRDYGIGAQILADLGLSTIRLLTNNPRKIVGLDGYGLSVTDQIPIEHMANEHNVEYLRAKKQRLGHLLHHQGLALDEEMIHEERLQDREREANEADPYGQGPAPRQPRRG